MKQLLIGFGFLISLACSQINVYDTVISGGYVFNHETGAFNQINLAITDGKIVAMGEQDFAGREYVDVAGMFVYPGFIDAHCHFVGYAKGMLTVNLVGTRSANEAVERVKKFKEDNPELSFIIGRGWDQNLWDEKEFPTKTLLNEWIPDIPVFLTRVDGHAAWVNDAALTTADSLPLLIKGGAILRKDGEPTGILIDKAMALVKLPDPPVESLVRSLIEAQNQCAAFGLTSLTDAGLSYKDIMFLDSLYRGGILQMPLYAMISDHPDNYEPFLQSGILKNNHLHVRSIKVYGDGALGSRGALLLEPYADDPHNKGLKLTDEDYLIELCKKAYAAGFQVNVHAIGDAANRMVLQTFAKVLPEENDRRWRVEHAQVINPEDMAYFGNYAIIPSVQPTHATSDMPWAEQRLGKDRIWHAYAFKKLLSSAGILALGTDFPVEDIDPRKTFYSATVGKDVYGESFEGYDETKMISRLEALKGMTIWAAYAQFEDHEKGSLEVGKLADLFISPTNLLTCDENEILSLQVHRTMVSGKWLHQSINK